MTEKLVLMVWPDGAWYATDGVPPAASKPIAKGEWRMRRNGAVVAWSELGDAACGEAMCRAVCAAVEAMGYARRGGA